MIRQVVRARSPIPPWARGSHIREVSLVSGCRAVEGRSFSRFCVGGRSWSVGRLAGSTKSNPYSSESRARHYSVDLGVD